MSRYGAYGRPNQILDAYIDWRDLQEADSKADFASWLWGAVNLSVWQGYSRIQSAWDRYSRIENLPDFRERRLRGLNNLTGFGFVGDHGEYVGMHRTDRGGPGLAVDTYGAVYEITRQAIINDDSGDLLNRNPADMGYAASLFVTQAIIALLESNPNAFDGNPFFGSAHANSGTAALSEDSIVDAISSMQNQRDDDNFRIQVTPQSLLVPNARLELIAKRILRSSQTGTTTTYTGAAGAGTNVFDKGTDNAVAGILPDNAIIREPFLTDQTDWYLFADPATTPALAVGFLNGNRQPFVGLKDPSVRSAMGAGMDPYTFELDLVAFKVRQDFGVSVVDWRGAYKATVAG